MKRLPLTLFLALVATCLLGGCSTLRFAYDNADTYLRWRAGSYFDLHGEDADELDDRIQALLAWHRRNALPQYAQLMDETARRFGRGLSQADLEWGYDSIIAQVRESARAAAQQAAPLLDRLTPEQIAHMEQGFGDDNRKFAREFLRGTESERRQRRYERMVDRLEDWVGRLSQGQRERVRLYSERAPLLDELRDRERKRMQSGFVALARSRTAQKRLPEFAANWDREREPAFVAGNLAWRREVNAMGLDIDRMLTPEQRSRAIRQLRRYAQDMRVLASRGERP